MSKGFFKTIVRRIQHGRWIAIRMYGEYEKCRATGRTWREARRNLLALPIPDIKKIKAERKKKSCKSW